MNEYHGIKINGKKYDEHRVVAGATNLGRNMVVHHIDGNKRNNDPSNLQIMSRSDHCKLHGFGTTINSLPRFEPNEDGLFVCAKCGIAKEKTMFVRHSKDKCGILSTCKDCDNLARRQKRRGVEKR